MGAWDNMEGPAGPVGANLLAGMMERASLCVSGPEPGVPAHDGDTGYHEVVDRHYTVGENNAVEQVVQLKAKLRAASTYDFWRLIMEGMTRICKAQYGFITKRILVDDEDSAIEMPPIGEPGSCLLGVAFYYNDGKSIETLHRDYKYLAYGAPCHNMKHDKVFLIPEGLPKFILNNPNAFPFPTDAYLGIPLFAEGKCFAHFGMMWTVDGLKQKDLSWAYVEMLLHALEDVILERLVEGQSFAKKADSKKKPCKVIPTEAVTAAQSLKPYARSLSHELRTPMQGVVGMLDVMHATVQESLEGYSDPKVRKVLKTLRENIEVVQDSSRRAVEAADNVVHAYDLNMQVPDTPIRHNEDESNGTRSNDSSVSRRPSLFAENLFKRSKRPRTSSAESNAGPASKHRLIQSSDSTPHREVSPHTASLRSAVEEGDGLSSAMEGILDAGEMEDQRTPTATDARHLFEDSEHEAAVTPGLRHTRIRDLLQYVVNESLRIGGRPESAIAQDTDGGEVIEVKTRNSKGKASSKIIEWSVDDQIPETIFVDERDLAKLVSCVFLNAMKFTERGKICVKATLSSKGRYVMINITDTGPGIPKAFLPYLFQPFSREDDSTTRQKEGLGLGLMVAKGLARRIGGDLECVRSDIAGPRQGSEFELRVPLSSDKGSRNSTPSRNTTPAHGAESASIKSSHGRERSSSKRQRTPRQTGAGKSKTPDVSKVANTSSPQVQSSHSRRSGVSRPQLSPSRRASIRKTQQSFDRDLAKKHPLTFLVAEDNDINRRLLVNMLSKFGYTHVHEADDGAEAVRQMSIDRISRKERPIDVILMDLWMPNMDGYTATEKIFAAIKQRREQGIWSKDDDDRARRKRDLKVLAVSADITDEALEKASDVGMEGFMTKPYKLIDLERLIREYCVGEGSS